MWSTDLFIFVVFPLRVHLSWTKIHSPKLTSQIYNSMLQIVLIILKNNKNIFTGSRRCSRNNSNTSATSTRSNRSASTAHSLTNRTNHHGDGKHRVPTTLLETKSSFNSSTEPNDDQRITNVTLPISTSRHSNSGMVNI